MTTPHNTNNLVGTAGEYFVCAELCRIGYLALLTPKNNPLFDVVASKQDGSRSVVIQVKTRSIRNTQGWKLGKDVTIERNNPDLFVALVNLEERGMPEIFIYEYDVLARRVNEQYMKYIDTLKKDGSKRKEVGFRWHDTRYFTDDDNSRRNNWSPIIAALATEPTGGQIAGSGLAR